MMRVWARLISDLDSCIRHPRVLACHCFSGTAQCCTHLWRCLLTFSWPVHGPPPTCYFPCCMTLHAVYRTVNQLD